MISVTICPHLKMSTTSLVIFLHIFHIEMAFTFFILIWCLCFNVFREWDWRLKLPCKVFEWTWSYFFMSSDTFCRSFTSYHALWSMWYSFHLIRYCILSCFVICLFIRCSISYDSLLSSQFVIDDEFAVQSQL